MYWYKYYKLLKVAMIKQVDENKYISVSVPFRGEVKYPHIMVLRMLPNKEKYTLESAEGENDDWNFDDFYDMNVEALEELM